MHEAFTQTVLHNVLERVYTVDYRNFYSVDNSDRYAVTAGTLRSDCQIWRGLQRAQRISSDVERSAQWKTSSSTYWIEESSLYVVGVREFF